MSRPTISSSESDSGGFAAGALADALLLSAGAASAAGAAANFVGSFKYSFT